MARSASLVRKGLHEQEVQAALGDLDRAGLPARTVAALRLADCLAGERPLVDEALFTELRRHFDEGQILELGAALTVASGWQRFIEAFGIRPDTWTEATPLPWADGGEAGPP
ncbi:MAG: carboxymuconolactone decarboxylase family protein [Candidatus Rokuibacteriota bacterium]